MVDRRLLREATAVRTLHAAAVACGTLGAVLAAAQALLLSRAVGLAFLGGRGLGQVGGLLGLMAAAMAGRAVLSYAGDSVAARASVLVRRSLRSRLFAHILRLGPRFARGERTGELAGTVVDGVEAIDAYYSQYLPQLGIAVLAPLVVLGVVTACDALSGLVLLLTGPLIPLFMVLIGKLADARARRQWGMLGLLSARFLDVLEGLTTLKLLGRSSEQAEALARTGDEYRAATLDVMRVAFLSAFVLEMVGTLSTAIVAVEVGLRLLYGRMPFEPAFAVLVLAPEFYAPLRLLGMRFHAGIAGAAAAERIYCVLGTPVLTAPRPAEGGPACGADTVALTPAGSRAPHVRLDRVSYTYPHADRPALDGVTLDLPPGALVAVVGPTGAGKSTFASLILRFAEPDSGAMTADGVPLRDLDPGGWRRGVAWVPQDPYLFHESAADNIRRARPEATDEEVAQAAAAAHADGFLRALPRGFGTMLGERGARLSGGQAQRVALARAFLAGRPILLLDEPTAHLDAETEAALQGAIESRPAGQTVVVIAHRLNTCVRADHIVVLDAGRVAEEGTHRELVALGGLYARMVAAAGGGRGEGEKGRGGEREQGPPPTPSQGGEYRVASPPAGGEHVGTPGPTVLALLGLVRPYWRQMLQATALSVGTVGANVALMAVSAWVIASAALHPGVETLSVAIVGVRAFGILRGVCRYAERLVSHDATLHLLADLRVRVYRAVEPHVPALWLTERRADWLSRLVGDVDTLQNAVVRAFLPAASTVVVALLSAGLFALYSPVLAGISLAATAAVGLGVAGAGAAMGRGIGRAALQARADLHSAVVDGVQGCADIVALGAASAQVARAEVASGVLAAWQLRGARLQAALGAAGVLTANLAMLAALAVVIPMVRAGALGGVYVPVLALAMLASFEAALGMPAAWHQLDASLAAVRRLTSLPASAEGGARPETAGTGAPTPETTRPAPDPALEVRDLSFRYAADEAPVLRGVSFELWPGRMTAVVGPSGAGKSTLLALMARFWDYHDGSIMVAGRELRTVAPEEARARLAVVAQDAHLFNASVRDNLLLAMPGATEEQLEAALERAGLADVIASLLDGCDTVIGERGLRLSGGERRRLALARAFLRDAPILALDEATAGLDAATEAAIMRQVRCAASRQAVVVITHRLAGIVEADEILVLHEGRIVERGRHEELLRLGGLYRRMWDLQTVGLAA